MIKRIILSFAILSSVSNFAIAQRLVKLNMLEKSPLSNMVVYSTNDSTARYTKLLAGTGIQINYNEGDTTLTIVATGTSVGVPQELSLNDATRELSITDGNTVDLSESIQDEVATLLQAGSNVTLTYDDGAGTLTIASSGGGGGATNIADLGDVTITSATTGQVLKYDGAAWINGVDLNTETLGALLDVDTTGKADGSIILYDETAGEWQAQANSINNLTDGVRGSKYIHLGSIGAGNYNGVFIGNNILQNITDPREGKNVVIGYNIANSERPMIANTVAIGDNQGHMNQFGSTVQSVTIGNNIALGGRVDASVMIGFGAGQSSGESIENVMIGNAAGSVNNSGSNLIMLGHSAQPSGNDDDNEIVIGGRNTYNAPNNVGYGSNTVKIGNPQMSLTGMFGRLLLNGYGAGNREAADLSKTRSPYIAAFATDGTLLELDTTGLFGAGSGGASDLGALTDVDTTGKTDGSIILYDETAGEWQAQANSIDNLTDGYKAGLDNLILGREPFPGYNGAKNIIITTNGVDSLRSPDGYSVGMVIIGDNAYDKAKAGSANSVVIGSSAMVNSTGGEDMIVIGGDAAKNINSGAGVYIGAKAGRNLSGSVELTRYNTIIGSGAQEGGTNVSEAVVIGTTASAPSNSINSIVIGSGTIIPGQYISNVGKGSNSAKLGNERIDSTFLYGNLHLPEYGLGNKEAADLGKTASAYIAGYATDGTLIELPSSGLGISLTDLSVTQNSPGTAGLTYNNTNGVFTYTPPDLSSYLTAEVDGSVTNEIQDLSLTGNTLSLSGDATTVDLSPYLDEATTASNGLTLSGTDVKLGGTLSDATTTIDMNDNALTFTNNGSFTLSGDGGVSFTNTSATDYSSVLSIASTNTRIYADGGTTEPLNSINLTSSRSGVKEMDIRSSVSNDNGTYTLIALNPTRLSIKTPNVTDVTAQNGQFLKLVDRLTGEVEFDDIIDLTSLSVTTNSAGTAALSYNNTNGVFTYTPPDLSGYLTSEVDGSTTNELQNLSLAGTTLSISDGNSVDLSGFLRDTLTGTQTIVGNTNDYIFNGINDYQINLTGDKAFYVGHSKMYIRFDATEMKLYSSDTPINIEGAAGVNLEFAGGDYKFDNTAMQLEAYGSGDKEAGDLSKTPSDYKAAFATDGTLIEVSNIDAMVIACSDETTDITTGTAKVTFRAPHAMTITGVRASLTTASSSGDPTVDINEGGTSILGTKLSIDANEKTSTIAATPATITDDTIADDAEITIDIDAAGTGATGLKVTILYRKN